MGRFFCLFLCAFLGGCDSPAPAFRNVAPSKHVIGTTQFSVYVRGQAAQAVRTNVARRPDIRLIARQAQLAMEDASGCAVVSIAGDVALLTGELDCSKPGREGAWATWSSPRKAPVLCDGTASPTRWGDWADITLACF